MDADRNAIPDTDPYSLFDAWFAEARTSELNDPHAMALATATPQGAPSVRIVLFNTHGRKLAEGGGFVFYTNVKSRKGEEIVANPQAALLFHWKSLRRQVRVEGALVEVPAHMADDYFRHRARDSQIGAAASDQSRPLDARKTYLSRVDDIALASEGADIARPPHWRGFRLVPHAIEFWMDRANRLHERRRFTRAGDRWASTLLYP